MVLLQYCCCCVKSLNQKTSCTVHTASIIGFDRCCRQAPGLGSRGEVLLLVLSSGAGAAVVWVHERVQKLCLWPLGRGGYVKEHSRLHRPITFLPSNSDRVQTPRNAISHALQRGYTAAPAWGWSARRGVDCQRPSCTGSLSVSHATPLGLSRQRRDLVTAQPLITHARSYKIVSKLAFHWCVLDRIFRYVKLLIGRSLQRYLQV